MDGDEFLVIAFLILLLIGVPIGVGLLLYFIPKRLGYPKAARNLTITYVLIVMFILARHYIEDLKHDRKLENAILLADREAPIGWVYLRIFKDSSFEFESRGFGGGTVYSGKAEIISDTIFFFYKDSIPKAGNTAVYSDKYVAFTNGSYPERVEISLSKLGAK